MNFPGDNHITFSEDTLKEMIRDRMQQMMRGVRVSRITFSGYSYNSKAEITFTTDPEDEPVPGALLVATPEGDKGPVTTEEAPL